MIKKFFQLTTLALTLAACSSSDSGGGSGAVEAADVPTPGVWVVNRGTLSLNDSVMRIDPAMNSVVATFSANGSPASKTISAVPASIVFCNGKIFVGSYADSAVEVINPARNEVQAGAKPVNSDSGLACVGTSVWGVSASTISARIFDPAVAGISQIDLPTAAAGIAKTDHGIWIADLTQKVSQYDEGTRTKTAELDLNIPGITYMPVGMTGKGDFVFILANNNSTSKLAIIKVNVKDKVVVYREDVSAIAMADVDVASGARLDLIEAKSRLWIPVSKQNKVYVVDTSTGMAFTAIAVGNKPKGVTFGFDSVWVTNSEDGTVSRISPVTTTVEQTITVGANPVRITISE